VYKNIGKERKKFCLTKKLSVQIKKNDSWRVVMERKRKADKKKESQEYPAWSQ
jgi:hypothetical protein